MKHTRTNPSSRRRDNRTRGNTIVLVAGILVLLVIIATTYLTRTQSQRIVSVATNTSQSASNAHKVIAEDIAEMLALQLFVWPIDPDIFLDQCGGDPWCVMDANLPRLHPTMYSMVHFDLDGNPLPPSRYNADSSPGRLHPDSDVPAFAWHYAPYHTVPSTNWPVPQVAGLDESMWPAGPGNPDPSAGSGPAGPPLFESISRGLLASEYNALGGPGFSDNKLLADIEPVRIVLDNGAEAFAMWRKMSDLSHPNNSWRIIGDTADVENNIVHNLNLPVAQFLPFRSFGLNPSALANEHQAGNTNMAAVAGGVQPFNTRWRQWFGLVPGTNDYEALYARIVGSTQSFGSAAPPSFINLRNPNANAVFHEVGERPHDEFVPGTLRHNVSRVLADTTGDGFTDAFWFITPIPVRDGVMTIAAVRVVDNSAMLNMNVAGRFQWSDPTATFANPDLARRKTKGHFPPDLAAVSALTGSTSTALAPPAMPPANNRRVGLFDFTGNWYQVQQYDESLWEDRHLAEIGFDQTFLPSERQRREFWRLSGRLGLSDPDVRFTDDPRFRPYGLSDEIELRMFAGNNHPWILSRFEHTTQAEPTMGSGILRAAVNREESTEYMDQLSNTRLVRDLRRHVTLYSGARNDQMPPWLWWTNRRAEVPDIVEDFIEDLALNADDANAARRRFAVQSRLKLDLREMENPFYGYGNDGIPLNPPDGNDVGRLNFRDRLAQQILLALTDDGPLLEEGVVYNSYYGPFAMTALTNVSPAIPSYRASNGPLNRARRLAAGYTANILAYTKAEKHEPTPLADAVLLPEYVPTPADESVILEPLPAGRLTPTATTELGYLPIERQPFLTEVLLMHVHVAESPVPDNFPLQPGSGAWTGKRYFCAESDRKRTIIVVEIANPYESTLELGRPTGDAHHGFQLSVFGQIHEFEPNETLGPLQSRIYFAMPDEVDADGNTVLNREKWMAYMGILGDEEDPQLGEEVAEGPNRVEVTTWSTSRSFYDGEDGLPEGGAVEVHRVYENPDGSTEGVVVDRIDLPSQNDNRVRTKFGNLKDDEDYKEWLENETIVPEDFDMESCSPPEGPFWIPPPPPNIFIDDGAYHQLQWVHAKRAWQIAEEEELANKKNPRFVFAFRDITEVGHGGPIDEESEVFNEDGTPNCFDEESGEGWPCAEIEIANEETGTPELTLLVRPFRFGSRNKQYFPGGHWEFFVADDGTAVLEARDFGVLDFPMQMIEKRRIRDGEFVSADFEQVGELLGIWLFGHEVDVSGGAYGGTTTTFSEFMTDGRMTGIFGNFPVGGWDGGRQFFVTENTGDEEAEDETPAEEHRKAMNEWRLTGEPYRVNRLILTPMRVGPPGSVPMIDDGMGGGAGGFRVGTIVGGVRQPVGGATPDDWERYWRDPRHAVPALPAGVRLLDAFVCDGPGRDRLLADGVTEIPFPDLERRRFYNANGFTGRMTPGLININTAPLEVVRTLPHMTRIVHETWSNLADNPWPLVAQSMIRYRERRGDPTVPTADLPAEIPDQGVGFQQSFNLNAGPAYAHRGRDLMFDPSTDTWQSFFRPGEHVEPFLAQSRGERGMASIGETLLLRQSGRAGKNRAGSPSDPDDPLHYAYNSSSIGTIDWNSSWRIDYPLMPDRFKHKVDMDLDTELAAILFWDPDDPSQSTPASAQISTDVVDVYNDAISSTTGYSPGFHPDEVSEDAQEANLLFAGMSNLITTRSDVFTVYFRVRSFRQDPVTGRWDATNPDHIIEDARYVMLVDRSQVNKPTDRPKILYLEKLPK